MKNASVSLDKRRIYLAEIRSKLSYYEAEHQKLKEATSTLELAVWKSKIDESKLFDHNQGKRICKKKMKMDDSGLKYQCRTSCGADIVIGHVLPFLLPTRGT